MTALAGFWNLGGRPDADASCRRMLASQAIYGSHDERQWSDGSLAMGRRLFRTVPEDIHDRQPLQNASGRFTLVADVRLDNRGELAAALGLTQASASGMCDAAILLSALVHWGEGALDRLVGDFAFAFWDGTERTLLLARDAIGQRPMHYHRGDGFFAFASMPKGLHALPEIPYAPDEQAMAEFITLMPQAGPRSFFKGIEKLEGGHFARVTPQGLSTRRYWQPRRPDPRSPRRADYVEGLRYHFDQAVKSCLRGANGAVASHLSAGFDSAAVSATAARIMADTGGKVFAFTSVPREGYDGAAPERRLGDEGPLAAATASAYPNIEHVLIRSGHRSPVEDLDRNFLLYDRPVLNLCNGVWVSAINSAARDCKLTVLLTGQMGNMTISYAGSELLAELVRRGRFLQLWEAAEALLACGTMRWRGVLAQAFGPSLPQALWTWLARDRCGYSEITDYTAIRADEVDARDLKRLAADRELDFSYRPRKNGFDTRLWALRRSDSANYYKGILGGWGIDQRDPTADRRLVEYCLSVPMDEYLHKGKLRSLGRRALGDRVPAAVLDAPHKGYQAVDWHEGLTAARRDIAAEIARLAPCEPAARMLDVDRMHQLIAEIPDSGWERPEVMTTYRLALLRGISAGHFLRKAVGSNR